MYNGLLFIIDPHNTSKKPGRRTDKSFAMTVLGKLTEAFEIARQYSLRPIIPGDFFSSKDEDCIWLHTKLMRLLRSNADLEPICMPGNHDLVDTMLTDDSALAMYAAAGLLIVPSDSTPIVIDGVCELFPILYGHDVPDSVTRTTDLKGVMITHGDFEFGGAYPGAKPLKEVKGIDLWVNGHMHKKEEWVQKGQTLCCNPGNITRCSVDTKDHVPMVWMWTPLFNELTGMELKHEKDVFDLTGHSVRPDQGALMQELVQQESAFANLLSAESATEARKQDGSLLMEDMQKIMQDCNTPPLAQAMLHSIFEEAAASQKAAAMPV